MPRCYVAGPMRGYPGYNFPAFDAAEARVRELGFHPVSPAAMDRLYEGWGAAPPEDLEVATEDAKRFMRRDLAVLFELDAGAGDAIYLLNGWEKSKGARAELALAEFLGLCVILESGGTP